MITIARFSKPEEAHLFRHRLETGGVHAYILDENFVQMDSLFECDWRGPGADFGRRH
ncbi:MAG: hypothetical protein ABI162_01185 [Luteolibacter sp.]